MYVVFGTVPKCLGLRLCNQPKIMEFDTYNMRELYKYYNCASVLIPMKRNQYIIYLFKPFVKHSSLLRKQGLTDIKMVFLHNTSDTLPYFKFNSLSYIYKIHH